MRKLLYMTGLLLLTGAGCNGANTDSTAPYGLTAENVESYDAPENWARYWNIDEGWSFRYPGEYTADLDFESGEVKISDRETGEELISVIYKNDQLYFREMKEDVPWLPQIVGSVNYDE